jgi:DNA-directed RNA polymerase I, II, and III subunit RPABC2
MSKFKGVKTPYADADEDFDALASESEEEEDDDEEPKPKKKITIKKVEKAVDSSDEEEDEDEDEEEEENESDLDSDVDPEEEIAAASSTKETGVKQESMISKYIMEMEEEEEEDDDEEYDDENYLQKFDETLKTNIIADYHPELKQHNNDEVDVLSNVVRDKNGLIIDPLHRTIPILTKYEKARILGERAKQLNSGATPFIEVEPNLIDGYLIALKEFDEKKIPFIIKRPLPNGGCEYWKLKDLEFI